MPHYQIKNIIQPEDQTDDPDFSLRVFYNQTCSGYKKPEDFLPFFCKIAFQDGIFLIGTNNFITKTFDGNIIATEDFDSIMKADISRTSFVIPETSTVTGLKFIDDNLVRNFLINQ